MSQSNCSPIDSHGTRPPGMACSVNADSEGDLIEGPLDIGRTEGKFVSAFSSKLTGSE